MFNMEHLKTSMHHRDAATAPPPNPQELFVSGFAVPTFASSTGGKPATHFLGCKLSLLRSLESMCVAVSKTTKQQMSPLLLLQLWKASLKQGVGWLFPFFF